MGTISDFPLPQQGYHKEGFSFFLKNKFIYLFLAVLGLCCRMRAFSSCGERGLLFAVVCRLLIVVAPLVVERRL